MATKNQSPIGVGCLTGTVFIVLVVVVSVVASVVSPSYSHHVPQNCATTPSPCAVLTATCTTVQGWWGEGVNCDCDAESFGRTCNRCSTPETYTGFRPALSREKLSGMFVAKFGYSVGAAAVIIFILTLYYYLIHRFGSQEAATLRDNERKCVSVYQQKSEPAGEKSIDPSINAFALAPPALTKSLRIDEIPLIDPWLFRLLTLTGAYVVYFNFLHTPARYNDSVRTLTGFLTSTTDCRWYGGPIFASLSTIVMGKLYAVMSTYKTKRLMSKFQEDKENKKALVNEVLSNQFHLMDLSLLAAKAMFVSLVVLAVYRFWAALSDDTRSCCHVLWTDNKVDMAFYIVMLVAIGLIIWFGVFVTAAVLMGLMGYSQNNHHLCLTRQFFATDQYYYPYAFAVYSFLDLCESLLMFVLIALDINAWRTNDMTSMEPILKLNLVFTTQMVLLFLRGVIYFVYHNERTEYQANNNNNHNIDAVLNSNKAAGPVTPYVVLPESGNPLFNGPVKQALVAVYAHPQQSQQAHHKQVVPVNDIAENVKLLRKRSGKGSSFY